MKGRCRGGTTIQLTYPAASPVPAWSARLGPALPGAELAGRAGMRGAVPAAGGSGARHRGIAAPDPGGWPA